MSTVITGTVTIGEENTDQSCNCKISAISLTQTTWTNEIIDRCDQLTNSLVNYLVYNLVPTKTSGPLHEPSLLFLKHSLNHEIFHQRSTHIGLHLSIPSCVFLYRLLMRYFMDIPETDPHIHAEDITDRS